MASSVDLSGRYANCSGSRVVGSAKVMNVLISLSKHFITVDVRAMGLKSTELLGCGFFGTGTIMDFLKQVGITHCLSERLNITVNGGAS